MLDSDQAVRRGSGLNAGVDSGLYVTALGARLGAWRSIVTILAGLSIFAILVFFAAAPFAVAVDTLLGLTPFDPAEPKITVGLWAGGNLLIASMIPISGLLQWAMFGVRPGLLSSISGRFRWRWFGRVAVVFLPLWALVTVLLQVVLPSGALTFSAAHLLLVLVAVITVPLQAAGEEYLFRGLLLRAVGARFRRPGIAFGTALVATSLVFAAFHGPGTAWAVAYYFVIGSCFAIMTRLTGGLEASTLVHATANTMVTIPIILRGQFDEFPSPSGPVLLLPMTAIVIATLLIGWRAKRDMARTDSQAESAVDS